MLHAPWMLIRWPILEFAWFARRGWFASDMFPIINCTGNILKQLYWRTRNLGYLLEAILVLEFGLTVRK